MASRAHERPNIDSPPLANSERSLPHRAHLPDASQPQRTNEPKGRQAENSAPASRCRHVRGAGHADERLDAAEDGWGRHADNVLAQHKFPHGLHRTTPGRGDTGRTTGDVNTDHGGGTAAIARQGEEVVTERALTMGMGRPQSGCIKPHNVAK